MIPISTSDINDTDSDIGYNKITRRYQTREARSEFFYATIPHDVITMRYHAREARSEIFLDYLREPPGQANFFYTTSASLPAGRSNTTYIEAILNI